MDSSDRIRCVRSLGKMSIDGGEEANIVDAANHSVDHPKELWRESVDYHRPPFAGTGPRFFRWKTFCNRSRDKMLVHTMKTKNECLECGCIISTQIARRDKQYLRTANEQYMIYCCFVCHTELINYSTLTWPTT
jgi:hypothetical protein